MILVQLVGENVGFLGLDDTDSLSGGCTTEVFYRILSELPNYVEIKGLPRLVRLYPFAKRRTRGNAAVCAEINVKPEHKKDWIGFLEHIWDEKISKFSGDVLESNHNDREQFPSDPGLVWFEKQPDRKIYYSAVRREIKPHRIPSADFSRGGSGLIGATAACAWPMSGVTFESIAYRVSENIGKLREVCETTLSAVDTIPGTFWSRDPKGKGLIAPRGPCPVLFGIRATSCEAAEKATTMMLESEKTEENSGFLTFVTNQCSDDHISGINKGKVEQVDVLKNGHVALTVNEKTWMAFRSSGDVKNMAQNLKKGDSVLAKGLWKDNSTLHLEKLSISNAAPRGKKRPMCTDCGVRTKSMGKGQGVRCPSCGERYRDSWEYTPTESLEGYWVQPPIDSRRHLFRPLEWD